MKLLSITVADFLPFQGEQTVDFATDEQRNVTIIMGDNGAGKTSLAQAFEWCLYGRNPKGIKQVINAYQRDRIPSGQSREVKVEIVLVKDGIRYRIVRKQQYSRSMSGGRVRSEPSKLSIFYKVDGETYGVADDPRELRETIGKLLSEELSHYFFFDGEHVKSMRDEIEHGKSQDFANAVKAILGLSPIASAIRHLKGSSGRGAGRTTVQRNLTESLNLTDNEVLNKKRARIEANEQRIVRLEEEINSLDAEISDATELTEKWSQLLRENQASEEAQRAVERAQRDVKSSETALRSKRDQFFQAFKSGMFDFTIEKPVKIAMELMKDVDASSKGVPNINDVTIKYLLERHECICGTHFEVGDSIDEHLHELLKYVPPKDLGTYMSEFEKECRVRTESLEDLEEVIGDAYAGYRDAGRALDSARDELEIAEKHRDSIKHADVRVLRENLAKAERAKMNALKKQAINKNDISKAKKRTSS